jgi:hypothetical protein
MRYSSDAEAPRSRDNKQTKAVVPDIRAADYKIDGMYVSLPEVGDDSSAWKAAALRPL